MAIKSSAWIVGGAIALVGCASGFLLGFWAGTSNAIDQLAHDDAPDAREIESALGDLQRDSAELLRRVAEGGRTKAASADAAAASEERVARLSAAVDGLAQKIEVESKLRKGPGFSAIALVKADADLRAAHAFWTRDDLAARYGDPAMVRSTLNPSGSFEHLCYPLANSPPAWLDFVVEEERVVDVLVSDGSLPPY